MHIIRQIVNPLSVFVCESQPIVVEGLNKVLSHCEDMFLVGSAANPTEALAALKGLKPDVLLIDHAVGPKTSFQFIADVRSTIGDCQAVLWVNELAEVECFRALQLGARGILKKTLPIATLMECLRAVGNGNIWIENSISHQVVGFLNRKQSPRLTAREREIVKYICKGLRNKQIAEALSITAGTVKVHLMHIFEKTGAKDRFELAVQGKKLLGPDFEAEILGRAGD